MEKGPLEAMCLPMEWIYHKRCGKDITKSRTIRPLTISKMYTSHPNFFKIIE